MNFLAHAVFADGPDDVLFGSVVGDFFKRPDTTDFPDEFIAGLNIHQELDNHFDRQYPEVTSNEYLFDLIRHYSRPVIDVCCDHILALRWNDLFTKNMGSFVTEVHGIATQERSFISHQKRRIIDRMVEQNWLGQMRTTDGLASALHRLASSSEKAEQVRGFIPQIVEFAPNMEADILIAIPLIHKHMSEYMVQKLHYTLEQRLRWRDEVHSYSEIEGKQNLKER